jgi:hypothetical protein
MTHTEILNGSYLLTFRQVAVEPNLSPVAMCDQFTLWQTETGFIATSRVKKARFRGCRLSFPYLPGKVGRPDETKGFKTYFCPFEAIKPKKEYSPLKFQVFLYSAKKSTKYHIALRRIEHDAVKAAAFAETIKASEYQSGFFYRPYEFEIWKTSEAGSTNFDGWFWMLKKEDKTHYKYVKACSTEEFRQLAEIASAFNTHSHFWAFVINY